MIDLISSFMFAGVVGNFTYDVVKELFQRLFNKNLEAYFLSAFRRAVNQQRDYLITFGDPVEIDDLAFRRVIAGSGGENVVAKFDDEEFINYLAGAMQRADVLIVGGHNLDTVGYEHIIRNLLLQTRAEFQQAIVKNQPIFNQILLSKLGDDKDALNRVIEFFSQKFDLVLQKMDESSKADSLRFEAKLNSGRVDPVVIPPINALANDDLSLSELRDFIVTTHDLEEFRTLCQDLNVDYDSLRGEGKIGKVREFVSYLNRQNRLEELLHVMHDDQ